MIAKTTAVYPHIRANILSITEGVIVSIDPSIGSTSSQPGWAVYRAGKLMNAGTFEIDPTWYTWERLQRLSHHVRKLYAEYDPDVLVFEDIPSQRYGGGNANAHASLLKAVGVILSISGPDAFIGLHPITWKKLVRSEYRKGDMEDAIEMGWIAIQIAREIEERDPPTRQTKRKKKTRKEEEASTLCG